MTCVECDRIERIGHAPQRRHVTDRSIHGDAKRIRCVSDLAAEATAEFKRSSKTELNLGTLSSVLLAPPEQDVSPFGHSVNTAIGIDDDLITGRDYNPPISVRLSWLTPPNAIGAALLLERARLLVLKADYRDCARCLRRKARTTHLPRWTGNISFCITCQGVVGIDRSFPEDGAAKSSSPTVRKLPGHFAIGAPRASSAVPRLTWHAGRPAGHVQASASRSRRAAVSICRAGHRARSMS